MLRSCAPDGAREADSEIVRELRKHPAFAGSSLEYSGSFPARHSKVLEYRVASEGHHSTIVVKRQSLREDRNRAVAEFANLTKVRSMLDGELAESIPQPLLALPIEGILVTRRVPGIPLPVIIKKYGNRICGPFLKATVAQKVHLAGRWLKSFQAATQAEPIAFDRGCFLAKLEKRLSMLESKGFGPELAREILDKMSHQTAPLHGRFVCAAARHGDFVPQNVMVENERVGIVDFEAFAERHPVYYDPSMFLGYLLLLRTRMPYYAGCLDAARAAFFSGFSEKRTFDQDLFTVYSVQGVVRVIADGPPLKRGWGHLGMIANLAKCLKELATGAL